MEKREDEKKDREERVKYCCLWDKYLLCVRVKKNKKVLL